MKRHHQDSEYGTGPRAPLCRAGRRLWLARVDLHRRAGNLTALHVEVSKALLRRLGGDGRLDPSHATIAEDTGCSERTVRTALARLRSCGLLRWVRRLVRCGWAVRQTSSAYELLAASHGPVARMIAVPGPRRVRSGGNPCQGTQKEILPAVPMPWIGTREEALQALSLVSRRRQESRFPVRS